MCALFHPVCNNSQFKIEQPRINQPKIKGKENVQSTLSQVRIRNPPGNQKRNPGKKEKMTDNIHYSWKLSNQFNFTHCILSKQT
jgi:hypothetical protein